ncbi:MAG: hypothetical protein HY052_08170 [Proteobacteria bacterium]|nr:hypothetical protein [Pseudomonadota bacterium]
MAIAHKQIVQRPAERVILPICPAERSDKLFEIEVYTHFMSYLRRIPHSLEDVGVRCGIQRVADKMRINPDLAAKILVDIGLRAPRQSFPPSFLDWCDFHSTKNRIDREILWSTRETRRAYRLTRFITIC